MGAQQYTVEQLIAAIDRFQDNYSQEINAQEFFGFPLSPILEAENRLLDKSTKSIAYFSMEYGIAPSIYNSFKLKKPLSPGNTFYKHDVFSNYWLCDYIFKIKIDKMLDIPIYGGGLGVLAGDTVKSVADLGISLAAVGVLWNKGYFKQNFWYKHGQVPEELKWDPYSYPGLVPLKTIVDIDTKEGPLYLRLWKYYIYSYDKKNVCPIILLDSNVEQNKPELRRLTDQLYRSDNVWWKIYQRVILGLGGMKALRCLGYQIDRYHLNEGHAAFALLEKYISSAEHKDIENLKRDFIYTCHTPVAAGHDRFRIHDIDKILTDPYKKAAEEFGKETKNSDEINLTYMCLTKCGKVNAVAKKHGEVMHLQFPDFASKITSITNGIHTHTWLSESFRNLFDKYVDVFGDWRRDPQQLARISQLRQDKNFRLDLFEAHQANKRHLTEVLKPWQIRDNILTIGWARRIAGYKRPSLIFHNIEALIKLAYEVGPFQIIFAGKAHPNDNLGGAKIDEILNHIDKLNAHKDVIKVLILENYDTYFGKFLSNCVDVWLNNPLPPFEASGTSGMKAILNGVLQLTTVDGWVVEAIKDDIGWFFGYEHQGLHIGNEGELRLEEDSAALCSTLNEVIKLYYAAYRNGQVKGDSPWIDKMIHCIEKAAFFNTQRMVLQYKQQMWDG